VYKEMSANTFTASIQNKKAHYDYFIEEKLICGIELKGNEVKSIRDGKASIKESWIVIENGELILKKMHITAWETANKFDVDEDRERRLLATKKQIRDFNTKVQRDGYTLIPLKVFFNDNGKCKMEIGLCLGKHNYDKRATLKNEQVKRDIARAVKNQ
jgi:SsrA-binding protein